MTHWIATASMREGMVEHNTLTHIDAVLDLALDFGGRVRSTRFGNKVGLILELPDRDEPCVGSGVSVNEAAGVLLLKHFDPAK